MSSPLPEALLTAAATEGRLWVATVLETMARIGRPAAGGWPGTLPEARGRAAFLDGAASLSRADLEQLARALYGHARVHWARNASREPME